MNARRTGFTVIEMTFALVIGAILTSIAMGSFRNLQTRFAADGARSVYASLHQRARSKAVEKGETVLLQVWPDGDSARIASVSEGVTDRTDFQSELHVDLRSPYSYFYMCMTPRGYADYDCGFYAQYGITATTTDTIRLEFWQGGDSTSVLILPLGQLVGM